MIRRLFRALVRRAALNAFRRLPPNVQMEIACSWVADSGRYTLTPKRVMPWPAGVVDFHRFRLPPSRSANSECVFNVPESRR